MAIFHVSIQNVYDHIRGDGTVVRKLLCGELIVKIESRGSKKEISLYFILEVI